MLQRVGASAAPEPEIYSGGFRDIPHWSPYSCWLGFSVMPFLFESLDSCEKLLLHVPVRDPRNFTSSSLRYRERCQNQNQNQPLTGSLSYMEVDFDLSTTPPIEGAEELFMSPQKKSHAASSTQHGPGSAIFPLYDLCLPRCLRFRWADHKWQPRPRLSYSPKSLLLSDTPQHSGGGFTLSVFGTALCAFVTPPWSSCQQLGPALQPTCSPRPLSPNSVPPASWMSL